MQKTLNIAYLLYLKEWMISDSYLLDQVSKKGFSNSNNKLFRKITTRYNVARGIKARDNNKAPNTIIKLVTSTAANNWPEDLIGKAEKCRDLATKAREKDATYNDQASLMTKLMWFLKPNKWTLFDRYVADALHIKKTPSSLERMTLFYEKLHDNDFIKLSEDMENFLRKNKMPDLHAARVIDANLMLLGKRESMSDEAELDFFFNKLPSDYRKNLYNVTKSLSDEFSDHTLFKACTKK